MKKAPKNAHPAVAALYAAKAPTLGAVLAAALRGSGTHTVAEAVADVYEDMAERIRTVEYRDAAQMTAVRVVLAEIAKIEIK